MIITNQTKIKKLIKRIFPFVKYRWEIYAALQKSPLYNTYKKFPHLSFGKVRRFFYYQISEMLQQNDLTQEIAKPKNCKLEIEAIDNNNREFLRKFAEENYNKKLYRNWTTCYYKNNYKGYIALLNGQIIGYVWWYAENHRAIPPIELRHYNIKLDKNEVYLTDSYILPQCRGKGNAIEFLTKVNLELKKLSYSKTVGTVELNNWPAIWTYRILGAKDIKPLTSHVFFNSIVYIEKAIFLKDHRYSYSYNFVCHPLLSFRKIFN